VPVDEVNAVGVHVLKLVEFETAIYLRWHPTVTALTRLVDIYEAVA
jgi:hypothetical protein